LRIRRARATVRAMPRPRAATAASYVERVNRAIDHVLAHLDQPLPLDEVARIACFSPFHFHRVWKALVGEPLHQFVRRLRLERAVRMLAHGPRRSLTTIALACGFQSPSDFARCFKQRYGTAPSAFDPAVFRERRRADWQAAIAGEDRHRLDRLPPGQNPDGFVATLRALPPRCVAYRRVADSFRPGVVAAAIAAHVAWAEARGCAGGQWLGWMWEDPEVTAPEHCRYDVGVEVAAGFRADGEVGRLDLPAMTVAQVELRGGVDLELRALDWLFGTWLPSSGFVPAPLPAFEAWIGRPLAHGDRYFELFAQLPVERA
jgi:AraC family transcriptional regulator